MKNPSTPFLFCVSAVLLSSSSPAYMPPEVVDVSCEITLGTQAKCSDLVGIGVVLEGESPVLLPDGKMLDGYFILRIKQPFVGCISNQEIRVKQEYKTFVPEPPLSLMQTDPNKYEQQMRFHKNYFVFVPTNNVRIVIGVHTNYYYRASIECANWNALHENVPFNNTWRPPFSEGIPVFERYPEWDSWWYDTPENEPLTAYFSNAVHCLRFERNWTNYYTLCRDGLSNSVERIREDAKIDIVSLFYSSSNEQLLYIQNDPLLPVPFKKPYIDFLLGRGNIYRYPPYWRVKLGD